MGTISQEAILISTWDQDLKGKLLAFAEQLPEQYRGLFVQIPGIRNAVSTFVFAPSGSYKGFDPDIEARKLRTALISTVEEFVSTSGYEPVFWVEVGYGELGQAILRGNSKEEPGVVKDQEYLNALFYPEEQR